MEDFHEMTDMKRPENCLNTYAGKHTTTISTLDIHTAIWDSMKVCEDWSEERKIIEKLKAD